MPRCLLHGALTEQNTKPRYIAFYLENLTGDGLKTVSALMRDRGTQPEWAEKLRDVTSPGALKSLTGMQMWHLTGIMLLLLRPALSSLEAMVREGIVGMHSFVSRGVLLQRLRVAGL